MRERTAFERDDDHQVEHKRPDRVKPQDTGEDLHQTAGIPRPLRGDCARGGDAHSWPVETIRSSSPNEELLE